MKNILFTLVLWLFTFNASAQQSWQVVGEAGFPNEEVSQLTMKLDNNGVPYVAYVKFDGIGLKISVMKFENEVWQYVGNEGFSEYIGGLSYLSLAIDSNNIPYVAYRNLDGSSKITVMKFENNNWQVVGDAEFSLGATAYISLALDNNDVPYVSFRDGANAGKATVMKFENNNWQTVGEAGFSAGEIIQTSLIFDANNILYIAFSDGTNAGKATVMKFENNNWQTLGEAGFSIGSIYRSSLAVNSNNILYMTYSDNGNFSEISVLKFENNNWEYVGSIGISQGSSYSPSLRFDNNDIPYVAYGKVENYEISVVKFENNNWQNVGSLNYNGWESVSLGISDNGMLFLALKEISSPYGATVLKYDSTMSINTHTHSNILFYPNPANDFVNIDNISDNATIKVFDIMGKLIYSTRANRQITINTAELSNGIYLVQIITDNQQKTIKKLIIQ
ncbi:MAG: T9SS type A sorting domain-containing protein [Flavobacteriaceae bacterium]|jgi:hypothetical protein|nr:T9SS type A sorting domain-containing protein [Flavobacteriaceae bacterium]